MTLEGVSPYARVSNSIYYANLSSTTSLDTGVGFKNLDLTATSGTDSLIEFDVRTDKTFTPTSAQSAVLMVFAENETNTPVMSPIPIASIDNVPCALGTACQAQVSPDDTSYFYAAKLPTGSITNVTHRVGFYLQDLCRGIALRTYTNNSGATQGGFQAVGCDSDLAHPQPVYASGSSTITFRLHVFISVANITSNVTDPASLGPSDSAQEKFDINVTVQNAASTYSCSLTNAYFPSDSSIIVNTSNFTLTSISSGAPGSIVGVLAKKGGTVDLAAPFSGGNDIAERVPYQSGEVSVSGFTNTADLSDANSYQVEFFVRDAAGIFGTAATGCTLNGVRTASVAGFLEKDACFIATASYGSIDAAPVRMLRRFRDRVLRPFGAGRAFIGWYYSWSPRAADWLGERPVFRGGALLALTPLEIVAWLALHPSLLLAWVGLAAAFAVAFSAARRRMAK